MARPPTFPLAREEFDSLFDILGIWAKIRDGRLTDEPILARRLPARDYPGGFSDIIRHRNTAGFQVATSHRITAADDSVPHWHGKDIHIGDIVIRSLVG
jgi:hypothetical protein